MAGWLRKLIPPGPPKPVDPLKNREQLVKDLKGVMKEISINKISGLSRLSFLIADIKSKGKR